MMPLSFTLSIDPYPDPFRWTHPMPSLPLSDVRIIDLTRVLAGPLASQTLADLGAEVIKIERPGRGDDSRTYGPPYLDAAPGQPRQDNSFYLSANRNKQSVTVDISTEKGQQIIRDLAKTADVMMENYKVGDLARYGLDYDSIRAVNPSIIYCSITGFGQSGPYRKRPGYDAIFQAMGGLMSVTGHPDGLPGGGPMKVGPSIVDVLTGLNASNAVLAALYGRDARNGVGQHIDIGLLDCVVASLSHYAQMFLLSGHPPPRRGTAGNGGTPSQSYPCADGDVMLTCGNDQQYARLCEVLGHPELASDARFVTNNLRLEHREELNTILTGLFMTQPTRHWLERLQAAEVPSAPINDFRQVFADDQVRSRGMEVKVKHPLQESLSLLASPMRFSATPIKQYRAPPMLGADTDSVLQNLLGLDAETMTALRAEKVI